MESIQTEREDKFDVDAHFELPTLASLVPTDGVLASSETDLISEYFDTAGHDLLRRGITLRRRTGDSDNGWHAKVPAEKARTEIRLPLGSGADDVVPDELADVLRGAVMGGQLSAVATLTTRRTVHSVSDSDGAVVAEIADDEVSVVLIGGATGPRWREVEVELGPAGSESFLKKAGKLLRGAGARPSAHPSKLDRALSVVREVPADTGVQLLTDYLDEQVQAIVAGDVYLRRGLDPIHSTRVAIRRYRSTLRVFGSLFEDEAAAHLEAELSWYASLLGEVRDRQVQRARFAAALRELPSELVLGPVASRIENDLLAEQIRHRETAMAELDGDRYRALLTQLSAWSRGLPIDGEVNDRLLVKLARKAGKKAIDRTKSAVLGTDDEALHRARKASKRARYAAELVAPVVDKKVSKANIKRFKMIQEVLGEHQDAVIAADILRTLGARAGTTAGENGFTFGLLFERERRAAESARDEASKLEF
ncbi:CYTH and CHAD domain-containing protein [Rhodococcoides yunnanense]|uniref:CYTH and CHAD domain-containing protein n=1 Tax=Rhodococcoides yunnanense TaxID=278209 RepID=A0ABU4B7F7_9NOCA|nr:CYTH and CHAD domain-containing protein [Rhodococcus yunnanensis]MDV6260136.1 CYTH and CHAD domain-containing protein [Rhodococcus yunnanensis]